MKPAASKMFPLNNQRWDNMPVIPRKTQQTDLMFRHNPIFALFSSVAIQREQLRTHTLSTRPHIQVLGNISLFLFLSVFLLYCHWREKGENRIMAKHEVSLLRFPWDNVPFVWSQYHLSNVKSTERGQCCTWFKVLLHLDRSKTKTITANTMIGFCRIGRSAFNRLWNLELQKEQK